MKVRAVFFVVAGICGVTVACAPEPPERIWWRPGFSNEQFAADQSDCRARAQDLAQIETPTYLEVLRQQALKREYYVACLRAKGYRIYERDENAPGDGAPDTLEV